MTFKEKVLAGVDVPYARAVGRKIEGMDCVAIYFDGKAEPVYMFNDENFWEEYPYFLHYVRNGSALMINQARAIFGPDWNKYIKFQNVEANA